MEADGAIDVITLILRHRKDHPVKSAQIEQLTGVNYRDVSYIVEKATKRGLAICSGSGGYYAAATREEWEAHLEKEHGRAMSLLQKVSEGKRNFIDTQQITLFEQPGEVNGLV